jgi:hypothetical protein
MLESEGGDTTGVARMFFLGVFAITMTMTMTTPLAHAADMDRSAADFIAPSDIKWVFC